MRQLNKSYLEKLKNKEWYHQRFNGSPIFMSYIALAEPKKEERKPKGTEADVRVFFIENRRADWYLDMSDIKRGVEAMINLAKKDKNISTKLLHKWKKDEDKFQKFFDNFPKINIRQLSDEELLKLYQEYSKLIINRFTSSSIIDHFALGTDEIIANMMRKEIGKTERESDFTDIFSTATAPVHQSFVNKAEMDLLKITIESPNNLDEIKKYQQKYYWIKNNFIDAKNLSVKHFQKEIVTWLKSGTDLKKHLSQLENTPRINKQKKYRLLKKYKFSPLLRTLIKISEDFTWWQDERKKATFLNTDLGTKILGEMAT